jgi:hypothetical protein
LRLRNEFNGGKQIEYAAPIITITHLFIILARGNEHAHREFEERKTGS